MSNPVIKSVTVDIREGDIPDGYEFVRIGIPREGEWICSANGCAYRQHVSAETALSIVVRKSDPPTPQFKVGDWVRIIHPDHQCRRNQGVHRVTKLSDTGLIHLSNQSSWGFESSLEHCEPTPPKWLKKGHWLTKDRTGYSLYGSRPILSGDQWHPGPKCPYYDYIADPLIQANAVDLPREFEYLPDELCVVEGEAE